jgi:hypothetical protein
LRAGPLRVVDAFAALFSRPITGAPACWAWPRAKPWPA